MGFNEPDDRRTVDGTPMRVEAVVGLVAGLLAALVPVVLFGPAVLVEPRLMLFAAAGVFPPLAVAGTALACRTSRRPARAAAVVGALVLLIGLGGWGWAVAAGGSVLLAVLVPMAQVLVWLAGAAAAGGRSSHRDQPGS
jgi:hypothetical protein